MSAKSSPPQNFRIKETYRVRYEEVDTQGIVNHAQYAHYFTGARVAYLRAAGIDAKELTTTAIQPVVVHLEVDFIAPAHFDDHIDVWVRCPKIGETSLEFEYVVTNGLTQELQARGRTVLVTIDVSAVTSVRVPDELRRRIGKLEQW